MGREFRYVPSPTFRAFHAVPAGLAEFMIVRGPMGSGKSVGCCKHMSLTTELQPAFDFGAAKNDPDSSVMPDGKRHPVRWSKWLVGRDTKPELWNTTIKTMREVLPNFRIARQQPSLEGRMEVPSIHRDGTWCRTDFVFIPFDVEEDELERAIKSFEPSGAWINEGNSIPWKRIWMANSRVGRFQPVKPPNDGDPPLYHSFGTIIDSNSPNETNWMHRFEVDEKPDKMLFFVQPPALIKTVDEAGREVYLNNDEENARRFGLRPAENIAHLKGGFGYYRKMLVGGDPDDIKKWCLNQYGTSVDGKPIYTSWNPDIHVKRDLKFLRGWPLILGTDFGLTPAMTFLQVGPDGIVRVLDELPSSDMPLDEFVSTMVIPKLTERFGWPMNCPTIMNYCDPAGRQRTQTYGDTCIELLNRRGIPTEPCPDLSNDFRTRRDAVEKLLRERRMEVDARCKTLIDGFNGHYCYRRQRSDADGKPRFSEGPDKNNFYTHVHDSLQYPVVAVTMGGVDFSSLRRERDGGYRSLCGDGATQAMCL